MLAEHSLGLGADDTFEDCAVANKEQQRNARSVVLAGDGWAVVDVHLHDLEAPSVVRRQCLQDRGDRAARPTPRGPQIDKYQMIPSDGSPEAFHLGLPRATADRCGTSRTVADLRPTPARDSQRCADQVDKRRF